MTTIQTNQPVQAKALTDERAAFEAAYATLCCVPDTSYEDLMIWAKQTARFELTTGMNWRHSRDEIGEYRDSTVQRSWEIWKARALLASQPSAQDENIRLRILLMHRVCSVPYLDDGEMQDNSKSPYIDFKRDTIDQIEGALRERAIKSHQALTAQQIAIGQDVDGWLEVVDSYGPFGNDINFGLRCQIVLAEEVKRLRASVQADVAAVRDAALEEAAHLIETTRETTMVVGGGETERHLTARKVPDHDLTGRTWAKGIRALKSAAPAAQPQADGVKP